MLFPLKTTILEYYRNRTKLKTDFMKRGIHFLSRFTKIDALVKFIN